MAFNMPAIIRMSGPDMHALIPNEESRIDDDEGHDARRKEHQSDNIHEKNLQHSLIAMRQ